MGAGNLARESKARLRTPGPNPANCATCEVRSALNNTRARSRARGQGPCPQSQLAARSATTHFANVLDTRKSFGDQSRWLRLVASFPHSIFLQPVLFPWKWLGHVSYVLAPVALSGNMSFLLSLVFLLPADCASSPCVLPARWRRHRRRTPRRRTAPHGRHTHGQARMGA